MQTRLLTLVVRGYIRNFCVRPAATKKKEARFSTRDADRGLRNGGYMTDNDHYRQGHLSDTFARSLRCTQIRSRVNMKIYLGRSYSVSSHFSLISASLHA